MLAASGPCRLHRADERDRPVAETERRVGDEQVGVERVTRAQAVAVGAHALRAVEAEELRARRLVAEVAVRAGVVGREEDVLGSARPRPPRSRSPLVRFDGDDQRPLAQLQRLLDRLGQPRPDLRARPSAGR